MCCSELIEMAVPLADLEALHQGGDKQHLNSNERSWFLGSVQTVPLSVGSVALPALQLFLLSHSFSFADLSLFHSCLPDICSFLHTSALLATNQTH